MRVPSIISHNDVGGGEFVDVTIKNATVTKANVYYEGKVTSRTVLGEWREGNARYHASGKL